jgi:alpha-L-rhamnosidase
MGWDRREFLKTAAGAIAGASASPCHAAAAVPGTPEALFLAARPVWPEGRAREKNLQVGFQARIDAGEGTRVTLRIAASSLYRVFVNGKFAGHGPARAPHGFCRVDEWDISPLLTPGTNALAIEVAGYNVNSYYLVDEAAFLQAEAVTPAGTVLAATGSGSAPYSARVLEYRAQRVQRYSFQRTFSEIYRLKPGVHDWRSSPTDPGGVRCEPQTGLRVLPRRAPYPEFALRQPLRHVATGNMRTATQEKKLWKDRALTGVGLKYGGYREQELESIPSIELQRLENSTRTSREQPYDPEAKLAIKPSGYEIVDFGTNLTGFLGARLSCSRPARVFLAFDEILSGGDVDFKRLGCVNIVAFQLQPGEYDIESFEPYTLRYLKLIAVEGECEARGLYLRELANPEGWEASFSSPDQRLGRLFAAGRETFQQNAVDIFMDCPSRERAGWLCDSFFTARSAADLTGNTSVETGFIENFLLPATFPDHPEGMIPMCYPADHPDGNFIPNWALWFVLQLEEYLQRSGDTRMVEALRPRVLGIFRYLDKFRNESGLLEKLEQWVFVEWSKANDFVQDVNYPSNMLYAASLAAAGRIYDDKSLLERAAAVRREVVRQSFDGQFFVDNAIREAGTLKVTRNRTEVCQYFAFFTGLATPESHAKLWHTLVTAFGPRRKKTRAYPEIHPANAFVGNMLRLEMLSRYGLSQQLLDESVDYLLYMAERTGTLWENIDPEASCNHGFASHIVRTLFRDALGVFSVDVSLKTIRLRFTDSSLSWCEGTMPLGSGKITLGWRTEKDKIRYKFSVPAGYRVEITNLTKKSLVAG